MPALMRVVWDDAWYDTDETPPQSRYQCTTVGWMIDNGNKSNVLRIASTKGRDGYRDIHNIPMAMVRKVEKL